MPSVWEQFKAEGLPAELVDRLESCYTGLKEAYYLGKHKPSELEGGHLAELVLRILQWATGGITSGQRYTPLGQQLPRFDQEVKRLENLPASYSKTLRVHIPRVLLSMYDIRNSRGVGHPSGDVDPNLSDATLVATAADWVVAELLRIYHRVPLDEAQAIVHGLVERRVPVVEMFGDFPKVLRVDLSNPMKALLILYVRGEAGATSEQLGTWLRIPTKKARRILRRQDESALVHYSDGSDGARITRSGIEEVEARVDPARAI
jgi:hypothetical protein